jgi:hypothetical protein
MVVAFHCSSSKVGQDEIQAVARPGGEAGAEAAEAKKEGAVGAFVVVT